MNRTLLAATVCLFAGSAHAQTAPITGATCVSTGIVEVRTTIRIPAGTFDGGCKTYVPGPGMNAFSTGESQAANSIIFRLENGTRLRNVIIAPSSPLLRYTAQAITIYGSATLENVNITHGLTDTSISLRRPGIVNMTGITSVDSADRHIYTSGPGLTVNISNCVFRNGRKVYRHFVANSQNDVTISRCDISGMAEAIFRTDSVLATAKLTNSRLSQNNRICVGYAAGKCITADNVTY